MSRWRTRRAPWATAFAVLMCLAGPARAEQADGTALAASDMASSAALTLAAWVMANDDTRGRPFIIVDKPAARVFAYDAAGVLVEETAALIGAARGDEAPAGIGTMRLADISLPMRITPAGRYEARLGMNISGHRILWVDYDSALSLHAVVTGNVAEHRLQRLATPSILDNRISYGCINVPAAFYEDVVEPLFTATTGIVYILPDDPPPTS